VRPSSSSSSSAGALLFAAVLLLTSCSSDAGDEVGGPLITSPASDPSNSTSSNSSPSTTGSTERAPTTLTPDSTTSTTAAFAGEPCVDSQGSSYLVDVSLDDPDGGLNLRAGIGTANDVVLVLPLGTEVEPTGLCGLAPDGSTWWEVRPLASESISGWVSSAFLASRVVQDCEAGVGDYSTLSNGSVATGDFDGDGAADLLTIANDNTNGTAVVFVELSTGGFARGDLGWDRVGGVLGTIRPVGADRDMVIVDDPTNSGAATIFYQFLEVDDCTVRNFDGFLYGGGAAGPFEYCLEPTDVGIRLWISGEPWTAWHFVRALGDFVEVDIDPTLRGACLEPPEISTDAISVPATALVFGASRSSPEYVGLTAGGDQELGSSLASRVGAERWVLLGQASDIDPETTRETYELRGFGDDSLGGLRISVDVQIEGNGEGAEWTILRAETTALCLRGVDTQDDCL